MPGSTGGDNGGVSPGFRDMHQTVLSSLSRKERTMALETVSLLGNCQPWITNEYEHGAIRAEPKRVADRIFAMLDQRVAQT